MNFTLWPTHSVGTTSAQAWHVLLLHSMASMHPTSGVFNKLSLQACAYQQLMHVRMPLEHLSLCAHGIWHGAWGMELVACK